MKTAKAKTTKGVTSLDGKRTINIEKFDRLFDEGSDEIDQFIDWSNAKVVSPAMKKATKVNVDFPAWVVAALDREAERIGVARQAVIKLWIVEKLEKSASRHQESMPPSTTTA